MFIINRLVFKNKINLVFKKIKSKNNLLLNKEIFKWMVNKLSLHNPREISINKIP